MVDAALEAGAEDVVTNDDGSMDVITTPETFEEVRAALAAKGLTTDTSEVTFNATTAPRRTRTPPSACSR